MIEVHEWAEIRHLWFVEKLSKREISRRTGRHRATITRAIESADPPNYQRPKTASKLEPFKDEIRRLLVDDPAIKSQRVRELIGEQGYAGGKTICDAHVRELRAQIAPARTFQRTTYRPGEILQFDLWRPRDEIPVGRDQTRAGYVVTAVLGYSRAGAASLIFSKHADDILWGLWRAIERLGGLPEKLVIDREGSLHARGGRPTDPFAAFAGALACDPVILEPRDCQAKGVVERLQGFMETSFEPGRRFANELDFQDQLDCWFDERANVRVHKTLRERPADRLLREATSLRELPDSPPDTDYSFATRVPSQPYLRIDTNDYSVDPRFAGRLVEVRASQREITVTAIGGGHAAAHKRSFAKHLTITAPAHQASLESLMKARREGPPGRRAVAAEIEVELRDLAAYDRLVA